MRKSSSIFQPEIIKATFYCNGSEIADLLWLTIMERQEISSNIKSSAMTEFFILA